MEDHFASARLESYLVECQGIEEKAILLYQWNSELSAAFWESIGYLEVALRNRINRQLDFRNQKRGRAEHWIFDDYFELGRDRTIYANHRQPYLEIDAAIKRVRRNGKKMNPGQIISEMSFGFWHQMVSKKQLFLWPDLATGFPNLLSRDQGMISELTQSIRTMRNRIGHHHRIWTIDVDRNYSDLLALAGFIDEDLRRWISMRSHISEVLAHRPGK